MSRSVARIFFVIFSSACSVSSLASRQHLVLIGDVSWKEVDKVEVEVRRGSAKVFKGSKNIQRDDPAKESNNGNSDRVVEEDAAKTDDVKTDGHHNASSKVDGSSGGAGHESGTENLGEVHLHGAGWHTTAHEKGKLFYYRVSVDTGNAMSVRIHLGKMVAQSSQTIKNCLSEPCVDMWTFKTENGTVIPKYSLASFQTGFRDEDMWNDFIIRVSRLSDGSADQIKNSMRSVWSEVRMANKGFEITLFVDGFRHDAGEYLEFDFVSEDGVVNKRTERKIQKMGAIFSSWSVPKEPGSISLKVGGVEVIKININKRNFYQQTIRRKDAYAHVVLMVYTIHSRSAKVMHEVQHSLEKGSHRTYWRSNVKKKEFGWRLQKLHNLYEKVLQDDKYKPDPYESEEIIPEPAKVSLKIAAVIIFSALIVGFIGLWFVLRMRRDSQDSATSANLTTSLANQSSYSCNASEVIQKCKAAKAEQTALEVRVDAVGNYIERQKERTTVTT